MTPSLECNQSQVICVWHHSRSSLTAKWIHRGGSAMSSGCCSSQQGQRDTEILQPHALGAEPAPAVKGGSSWTPSLSWGNRSRHGQRDQDLIDPFGTDLCSPQGAERLTELLVHRAKLFVLWGTPHFSPFIFSVRFWRSFPESLNGHTLLRASSKAQRTKVLCLLVQWQTHSSFFQNWSVFKTFLALEKKGFWMLDPSDESYPLA